MLTLPRNTTSWQITGTETFRLSARKLFGKIGSNLQNPDEDTRSIYYADPGKVLVECDQSGAEAVIVSQLAKPGNFIRLFKNKIKPHVYVALHIFQSSWQASLPELKIFRFIESPIDEIKGIDGWSKLNALIRESDRWHGGKRYYYIGKKVCHAANYGMRGQTLQDEILKESEGLIAISLNQANEYLATYHRLFPEIQEWHRDTEFLLKQTRTLHNLFGYPRYFSGVWNDKFIREALAFVPQSTVGTITNIAFSQLQSYIEDEGKDWDLLNNKHDSYLCQCPEDEVDECAAKMKEFLEAELVSPRGVKFKMGSECLVGKNWGHYNEENPEGLKEYVIRN